MIYRVWINVVAEYVEEVEARTSSDATRLAEARVKARDWGDDPAPVGVRTYAVSVTDAEGRPRF